MTLELVGVVVLAIVVFAFVLEPVLRARGDRVVLDAVAMPRPAEVNDDDDDALDADDAIDSSNPERVSGGRVTLVRPVSSDIS